MLLFLYIFIIAAKYFAAMVPDIDPSSPFAISLTLDIVKKRVGIDLDYGLYQLLIIYHAARELNRIKPDIVVWLTDTESPRIEGNIPTADEILRASTSIDLYHFLKALPGLHFVDGLYVCSEFGDDPTEKLGAFGKATMVKFRMWTLKMYHRVLQYDLDQIPLLPAGFDRMFGVSGVQETWEKALLDDQDAVGFIHGGVFHASNVLLRPSLKTYREFCEIMKNGYGGFDGGWENKGKFQSPFCYYEKLHTVPDGVSNVAGGIKGWDWVASNFLGPEPADPSHWFQWKFHGAQWDQGLLWYYFVIKEETRGKVWLTSFTTNSSWTLNPKGNPKCELHPYLDIFEASFHFGGRSKMVRMGLYNEWIDRAMTMFEELNLSRFDLLRGYHEKWIESIRILCCKGKKGCTFFLEVCDCSCS